MDLPGTLEGIGEAAFVVDHQRQIVQWNRAARALLGHPAKSVIGRHCHEVLAARDSFGNIFCCPRCAASQMVSKGEPVHAFDATVLDASGHAVSARVAIIPLLGFDEAGPLLLHVLLAKDGEPERLREPDKKKPSDLGASPGSRAGETVEFADPQTLTRREIQVLAQLAASQRTAEVAAALGVSVTTVRTHVRNILRKLDANNRVRAVVIGLRNGWI